jgi:hypothetical protein
MILLTVDEARRLVIASAGGALGVRHRRRHTRV